MIFSKTEKINKSVEQTIVMNGGSTLTAPASWETKPAGTYLEIISPEKDVGANGIAHYNYTYGIPFYSEPGLICFPNSSNASSTSFILSSEVVVGF
jgi:hypothetical protein